MEGERIKLHRKRLGLQRSLSQRPSPEPVSNEVKVERDVIPADDKTQVSFFITKSQKVQLRELGYSDDDVARMKPAEAHKILGLT